MSFSKEKKLYLAVIGSGYWGRNLIRNYFSLGVLKMICDKNEELLSQFKVQYPDVDTCIALNDVISRDDIDALVIATPAETHFDLAREALLSGKHVYVEKPLVLHEHEAEELIAIAERRNLILMVGHLLQYHPVFRCLQNRVKSGELGRINYIYSHRLNLGRIRREENILWSFAPHDISMILSLAGEEPENVIALGGNYLHHRIADVTTTHLEFSSGLRAHIFVSWLHPFKEQKLVIIGTQKMAVFDDTQPWKDKLLLYPHEIKWQNNIPVSAKAKPEKVEDIPEEEPLRLECEHFLNCIRHGQKPITDGKEGLRVLRILNASQRSLNDNGCKMNMRECANGEAASPKAPENLREVPYFAHGTAFIDKEEVSIGKGTKIWHFSHIMNGTTIGEDCNIGQNVVVGPHSIVGNKCKIQNNVSVYEAVTLEEGVFCGPSMVFTNVYNPRAEIRKMCEARPTLVQRGATIGANATIICGHTLGRYCFIGAGAVVTNDVADYALVVGNPAKQIGWVCECGERLKASLLCGSCQKQYELINGVLKLKDI